MSQISLKSISGITSITTPAGVDNVFTVHTNDTTEKFRVDQTGNQNISGIVTASNFKTGVSNLHSVGLTLSGGQLDIGSNIKAGNAGVVTASAFHGDGSQLTGIAGDKIFEGNTKAEVSDTGSNGRFFVETEGTERFSLSNSGNFTFNTASDNVINANGNLTIDYKMNNSTKFRWMLQTNDLKLYPMADDYPISIWNSDPTKEISLYRTGEVDVGYGVSLSGSTGNINATGIVTASSFSGDGSNLTGISGVTVSGNVDNRVITGDGTNLVGESQLEFLSSTGGNSILRATAPEGGDAEFHLRADENDDTLDRYKLVSGADNHFQMYQMSAGGAWESRVKFHSERGNIEPIYDPLGLHGGGVVVAQCNTNSGNSSDSPNFKVDFTVPMGDINNLKREGAREGFATSGETGSTINPHGGSGILIASNFGNYYWGFATKIYHISCYGSYSSGTAVSLNQLHSYTGSGHGANSSHITLSVQSNPANTKTTPTLRATFGGDYWSSNYLVVTYVGSGVASYANLRSLSHINSVLTGQDTAYK